MYSLATLDSLERKKELKSDGWLKVVVDNNSFSCKVSQASAFLNCQWMKAIYPFSGHHECCN